MKSFKINPLTLPVFLIVILLGHFKNFFLTFLALAFHEMGHLIMMKNARIEINFIKIEPFGITIRLKNSFYKSEKNEILIALGGPLLNLILALAFTLIFKEKGRYFIMANLSVGVFNFLPLYPLDGGRILRCMIASKYGVLRSYKLILDLTKILGILLFIMGVYILFLTRFNFFICIISAFLIYNTVGERQRMYAWLLKEISDYKNKNKDIEKMCVKPVAVNKNFLIRKILHSLSFNGYYIFYVIESGKITATFSEGDLIFCLLEKGGKARIYDLM